MDRAINVLSLFDGISAGRLALERAGIKVNTYYRSEIDKYASQVAMHHYPDDVQLGDVTKWREWDIDWSSIDMLIGGSPCQGFSFAGKQAGTKAILNGVEILVTDRQTYLDLKENGAEFLSQSHLFWEYVLILDHVKKHNPNVKFLLENVRMKKELLEMISDALGVDDTVINSNLLSAQNRHRHYWCNWNVEQPEDKNILLKDILEDGVFSEKNKSQTVLSTIYKENVKSMVKRGKTGLCVTNVNPSGRGMNGNVYHTDGKSPCLTVGKGEGIKITGGAIRGRCIVDSKCQDHKMKVAGMTEQRLEIREDGKTNALTTVQKDNVVVRATVQANAEHTDNGKSPTLTAAMGVGGGNVPLYTCAEIAHEFKGKYIDKNDRLYYRKLTPTECARLQTFPDGWAESVVSKTQAYKAYGNSWTVDVIAHIFKAAFQ
nr:DNA (cytosine-5-)-methyltransferase [Acinetobacter sp. CFCC 10889]